MILLYGYSRSAGAHRKSETFICSRIAVWKKTQLLRKRTPCAILLVLRGFFLPKGQDGWHASQIARGNGAKGRFHSAVMNDLIAKYPLDGVKYKKRCLWAHEALTPLINQEKLETR